MTAYDGRAGKGRLASGQGELCVDLNLVLQGTVLGGLPLQSKLMVIGDVEKPEQTKVRSSSPLAVTQGLSLLVQTLTLMAICAVPVQELDIRTWEEAARKLSWALHQ